jgi:7-keto-8-aminopelargonate synthetase-like enzyme
MALVKNADGEVRRKRLRERIEQLNRGLRELGLLRSGVGTTPIFPIVVGEVGPTMEASAKLLEAGLLVHGIRPPTVPRGTARLRVSLMATHTSADVERLLEELRVLIKLGLISESERGRG